MTEARKKWISEIINELECVQKELEDIYGEIREDLLKLPEFEFSMVGKKVLKTLKNFEEVEKTLKEIPSELFEAYSKEQK